MVVSHNHEDEEKLVYGIRLSSVSSAQVTGGGEEDVLYELTEMDLAMKLHYIRAVYFFKPEAVRDITVQTFKEACFPWLNYYYEVCGRFRRHQGSDSTSTAGGRPYVKCNDCGVRVVEAKSSKTLDQWLDMVKTDNPSSEAEPHRLLVPSNVLGPELIHSPLVLLQLTFLKCGGLSLGLSWAHVLGDAFSATKFINVWAQVLSGNEPTHQPNYVKVSISKSNKDEESNLTPNPLSVKTIVDPIGDHWMVPTSCKMETLSFRLSPAKLVQIQTKLNLSTTQSGFEAICAILWKSIARTKQQQAPPPKTVTIIRQPDKKSKEFNTRIGEDLLGNTQVVSIVEASKDVGDADPIYLAELVRDQAVDERSRVMKMVEKEAGMADLVLYGTNLTFVDLENADWYGFKLNGYRPSFVNCFVDGVGEQGLVMVLPTNGEEKGERLVNVTLPQGQTGKLKEELTQEWCIGN